MLVHGILVQGVVRNLKATHSPALVQGDLTGSQEGRVIGIPGRTRRDSEAFIGIPGGFIEMSVGFNRLLVGCNVI
jgi:hypothetical protein